VTRDRALTRSRSKDIRQGRVRGAGILGGGGLLVWPQAYQVTRDCRIAEDEDVWNKVFVAALVRPWYRSPCRAHRQ
jgi:hypothetical protein